MHNHSYVNDFNLHVNEISFSYERTSTKTCFEKEAKSLIRKWPIPNLLAATAEAMIYSEKIFYPSFEH